MKSRIPFFLANPGKEKPSFVKRYGVAVLSVGAAFLIRFSLRFTLEDYAAFSLFTPAIIVAGWYGGIGPALFASGASFVLANVFFLKPFYLWTPLTTLQVVSALVYLLATAIVLRVVSLLRTEQQRVAEEARNNSDRAKALEVEIERRGKAEQRLREQEERLRLIFENARGIAIISFDINGRINDWNEGASRLFGYSRDEIIRRSSLSRILRSDSFRSVTSSIIAMLCVGLPSSSLRNEATTCDQITFPDLQRQRFSDS